MLGIWSEKNKFLYIYEEKNYTFAHYARYGLGGPGAKGLSGECKFLFFDGSPI